MKAKIGKHSILNNVELKKTLKPFSSTKLGQQDIFQVVGGGEDDY